MNAFSATGRLSDFAASLSGAARLVALRAGLIGEGQRIDGPYGPRKLVYADYIASGRALRQIEAFVMDEVLPIYANSHSEGSYCGAGITGLRREARAVIAAECGADEACAVIFAGAGATAGLNRLVPLLGVPEALASGRGCTVLVGPYEHHSNILPWRESGASVIEIGEAAEGGPDMAELDAALRAIPVAALKIGAFSAMSNVTGIVTDVEAVTKALKAQGALVVWDYAGAGPYLAIDMGAKGGAPKDAVVVSTHKFVGGPGASGVLILRKSAVTRTTPVLPGGGTVRFVSPWRQDYLTDLVSREESGTPDVIGDIRAALAFLVKAAVGTGFMATRHEELRQRALAVWTVNPGIEIIGNPAARHQLPVFSFRIRDGKGGFVPQQIVTRALSDQFGIQSRGGCSCAGPYAHQLLGIDQDQSEALRSAILAGDETLKPGWTRLNLSALADDAKVDFIIQAVDRIAALPEALADYRISEGRVWLHRAAAV
jgi:selenocysteine lyase/cysteine desulfurase